MTKSAVMKRGSVLFAFICSRASLTVCCEVNVAYSFANVLYRATKSSME